MRPGRCRAPGAAAPQSGGNLCALRGINCVPRATAVGKTSLVLRFSDNTFNGPFSATVGVDFKLKSIDLGNAKCATVQVCATVRPHTL